MALNFPSSPGVGEIHNASNGLAYVYDGVKWTSQGSYTTQSINTFKLDDISSQFTGSTKGPFELKKDGVSVKPDSNESLLISLGGVIQEPGTAYSVNSTNGTITFTENVPAGTPFWGKTYTKLALNTTTVTDDSITNAKVNSSAGILASKLNFTQTGSGASSRTVDAKLKDLEYSVLDFGVVADGSTDNTASYTNLITAAPAGSTIYWPAGTYRGRFHSTKAFHLKGGPNVILKPASDTDTTSDGAVIRFYGTEESPQAMSAQPAFGDDQIAHAAGGTLAVGDIVRLWDGWTRPSDSEEVNKEVLKVREATSSGATKIEGTVLSNQTHGTYTYTKLNTLKNISIQDFKIELGTTSTVHGIFCWRGENVEVSNIHVTGGKGTSIRLQDVYNAYVSNTSRTNATDLTSGYGYHLLNYVTKWVRVEHVRGHVTRHVVDNDSAYQLSVRDAYATQSGGTPFVISHNSSGGFQHWENLYVSNSTVATNAIVAAGAGLGQNVEAAEVAKRLAEILRNITIKNLHETSNRSTTDKEPASIYLQYQCRNLVLRDIYVVENGTLSGDAAGDQGQKGIRISGPIGGASSITGVHVEGRPIALMFDSDANSGKHVYNQTWPLSGETLRIRDITCGAGVRKIFYFKTPASGASGWYYLFFDIRDVHTLTGTAGFGTNGADWHSYLHVEFAAAGQGRFELDQIPSGMGTGADKVVVNGGFLLYFDSMKNSMSSSLTHVGNKLTQSDMISAGSPAGRYLRTAGGEVDVMEKPCGYGQTARFQCEGATTFDISAINASSGNADLGTHDGNDFVTAAGDFITLVATDYQTWRIYKSGQYADSAW